MKGLCCISHIGIRIHLVCDLNFVGHLVLKAPRTDPDWLLAPYTLSFGYLGPRGYILGSLPCLPQGSKTTKKEYLAQAIMTIPYINSRVLIILVLAPLGSLVFTSELEWCLDPWGKSVCNPGGSWDFVTSHK